MSNLKQSKKRAKQDIKKRARNKSRVSSVRTYIKKFLNLINLEKKELAEKDINKVFSQIDKGVTKGVFKKNKANRLKSKLNVKLNNIK